MLTQVVSSACFKPVSSLLRLDQAINPSVNHLVFIDHAFSLIIHSSTYRIRMIGGPIKQHAHPFESKHLPPPPLQLPALASVPCSSYRRMHILFYSTNIKTKVIAPHTYFSTFLSGSLQPTVDLSFRYGNVSPVPHHETFIIHTLKESTASPTRHFPVFAETHHLSCRILFLSFLLLVLKKYKQHT